MLCGGAEGASHYIWGGFVIGLSAAAVMLTWRYAILSTRAIRQSVLYSR